jgi:hypothetical protein
LIQPGPSGSGSQDRGAAAGRAAWPPGPLGVPGMEYRAGADGGRGEEEIANVLLAIAPGDRARPGRGRGARCGDCAGI